MKPVLADRTLSAGRFDIDLMPNKHRPEMNCALTYYDNVMDETRRLEFSESEIADLRALLDFAQRSGDKFCTSDRQALIADWPADEAGDKAIARRNARLDKRAAENERRGTIYKSEEADERCNPLRNAYYEKAEAYFEQRAARLEAAAA